MKDEYPELISNKYRIPQPAYGGRDVNFGYIGPAIQTTVRSIAVQHFAVCSEPDGTLIKDFKSNNGREAFNAAVLFAENRGLPWGLSGGGDFFEPASGKYWTYRYLTNWS